MEKKGLSVGDLAAMLAGFDIIDMSAVIEEGIPLWPTHPKLSIEAARTHETSGYYCQAISMAEHTATHVDAPAHIHPSMMDHTIDRIAAGALFAQAVKYPLHRLGLGPGDLATGDQILALEEQMGDRVAEGEIALLDFGWQKHWKTGTDGAFYAVNAPGLDESAAKLLGMRGIRAIGSDTIACDSALKDGKGPRSFAHDVYCLPHDVLIMEGLMGFDLLPARFYFIALPLRIKRGSGSPIKPVALIPRK
jgi:kynurenine formamidase